jgi:hypothetical protein
MKSNDSLKNLLLKYHNNINEDKNKYDEFEIRFGSLNTISKYQFNNVIDKIQNIGFNTINSFGLDLLRIGLDDFRIEIEDSNLIKKVCNDELNTLKTIFNSPNLPPNVNIIKKNYDKNNRFDNNDFKFRVSYQTEEQISKEVIVPYLNDYFKTQKYYRCLNRIEYVHDELPFICHFSIIKSSFNKEDSYKLLSSGLLQSYYKYEIEIELNNDLCKTMKVEDIESNLKLLIKNILCGLQSSNYPISYNESIKIRNEYISLLNINKEESELSSMDFVGPSTYILEMNHIQLEKDSYDINVHSDYTVTDKADGERKLLFISSSGKLYFINNSFNIEYLGIKTGTKSFYNTLIDGEHIWDDKINIYGAFDIYYINGNKESKDKLEGNVFKNPFWDNTIGRYVLLNNIILSIEEEINNPNTVKLFTKNFELIDNTNNLFMTCKKILKRNREYETDGLIFTPASKSVGWTPDGDLEKLNKRIRWDYSLKWKPVEQNTIDFLINIKEGINYSNGKPYKTMYLYCGFKGFEEPLEELLMFNNIRDLKDKKYKYRKILFRPSNPVLEDAYICNVLLKSDKNGKYELMTQENELIEDDIIVEFAYDIENKNKEDYKFLWRPLRIRYDKTQEYKAFKNNVGSEFKGNYGNDFKSANGNWYYINNPITEEMITTGMNIPDNVNQDIYYNKSLTNKLENLRSFHNYIKYRIINEVTQSNSENNLMDFAVGKGGDIPKWIENKLNFVFGIDIYADNIENKYDGACVRYFNRLIKNYQSRLKQQIPKMIFAVGDSSKLIQNGNASENESELNNIIINNIFGKEINEKYTNLRNNFGIGKNGFNITSCQFAIHYFFESKETLSNFISNIIQCTKENGYFICTSYDGRKVFDLLKGENMNYEYGKYVKDSFDSEPLAVFKIIKKYNEKSFDNNSSCLGFAIDVFQESINTLQREYLVNYEYFIGLMNHFGFNHVQDTTLNNFENIYEEYIKEKNNNNKELSNIEKDISFLNVCHIFQKRPVYESNIKFPVNIDDYKGTVIEETEVLYDIEINKKLENNKPNEDTLEDVVISDLSIYLNDEFILSVPEVVKDKYDENVVFTFYSNSNDKPYPGTGTGETIPNELKKDYEELSKIKSWRRMLSNSWIEPFELDGLRWNSVEHYYQASKFKKDNPDFYKLFSLDSESTFNEDPNRAKSAGDKSGKIKGELLRPKNIKVDSDFLETNRDKTEMYLAQFHKFTNKNAEYLKTMLMATNNATLIHNVPRSSDKILFDNLIVIRDLMKNKNI